MAQDDAVAVRESPDEAGLTPGRIRRGEVALCLGLMTLLAVGHFAFLMSYFEPAIHQPDANGYFAQATYLAQHGRASFVPASPIQYIGMHWLKTDDGRYFSHYPPGFSLVLTVPFMLGGPTAAMVVNPLMSTLTLVGLYLVASIWLGPKWGLLSAALMAFNPAANTWALGYFAHTATAFFLIWGIYFLARWEKTASWKSALVAGLLLGTLPSVRYPAVLFCAAAGLFALVAIRRRRHARRSALIGLVAMAVPICALLVRNHFAFGAFWRTGYSLTNEQTGFGWDYFVRNLVPYIQGLQGEGVGLLFGPGLLGMVAISLRRRTWRHGLLLTGLVVPVTLLYMSYYWGGAGRGSGAMRFLVPTFFIYTLAAVWLLAILAEVRARIALAAAVLLLVTYACWGLAGSKTALERQQPPARALATITDTLTQHVPAGNLIIAGNAIQQHLEFVGKWKLVDETVMQDSRRGRFLLRRLETNDNRPSPMQPEKLAERLKRYQGLDEFDRNRQFVKDLWTFAGDDGRVFWLVSEDRLNTFKESLPADWPDRFTTVAAIDLSRIETPQRDARRFRGGPDRPALRDRLQRRRPRRGMGRFGSLLSGGKLLLVEWTVAE